MYMFWHGGFALAVIVYALLRRAGSDGTVHSYPPPASARSAVFCSIAAVLAIVVGFTLFVTAGHAYLPVFIEGNRTTELGRAVLSGVWLLSLLALAALWRQRPRTVIDLWLMVVMCVWLFDIALAAILNTGRYDLGWYAGRIYGLLAASSLLIVLLIENGAHYARLAQLSAELSAANQSLALLVRQDGLTGLANRRFFDTYLANQVALARRHKRSLVLCDVDAFKAYNDHCGHQAGDACLKQIASVLSSCCRRPGDMAARYGGEEFALILPDTELNGAINIAEAARDAVARLQIPHAHSPAGAHVSISGGVAILLRNVDATAEALIAAADRTLFEAKRLGRNRMVAVQEGAAVVHS
jgi:diguanylate cyclase (GGDEF)-like protein